MILRIVCLTGSHRKDNRWKRGKRFFLLFEQGTTNIKFLDWSLLEQINWPPLGPQIPLSNAIRVKRLSNSLKFPHSETFLSVQTRKTRL